MLKLKAKKAQRGQGLVEYALILALVALVAIVILGLAGGSIQRVYGQVAALLGAKYDSSGDPSSSSYLVVESADCWVMTGKNQSFPVETALFLTAHTNIDISKLSVYGESRELAVDYTGGDTIGTHEPISSVADSSLCPKSVVFKSFDPEEIAVAPVTVHVD